MPSSDGPNVSFSWLSSLASCLAQLANLKYEVFEDKCATWPLDLRSTSQPPIGSSSYACACNRAPTNKRPTNKLLIPIKRLHKQAGGTKTAPCPAPTAAKRWRTRRKRTLYLFPVHARRWTASNTCAPTPATVPMHLTPGVSAEHRKRCPRVAKGRSVLSKMRQALGTDALTGVGGVLRPV